MLAGWRSSSQAHLILTMEPPEFPCCQLRASHAQPPTPVEFPEGSRTLSRFQLSSPGLLSSFPSSQRSFRHPAVQEQPWSLPEALLPHGALGRELQQRPPALLPVTAATPGSCDSPRRARSAILQPELYTGPALRHLRASTCSSVCPPPINLWVCCVLLGP